jgi:hypothetical protein
MAFLVTFLTEERFFRLLQSNINMKLKPGS